MLEYGGTRCHSLAHGQHRLSARCNPCHLWANIEVTSGNFYAHEERSVVAGLLCGV